MKDYVGQQFGHIKVVSPSFRKNNSTYAIGECQLCGKSWDFFIGNLKNGYTTKCRECGQKHRTLKAQRYLDTLGMRETPLYQLWQRNKKFMCDEWKTFASFYNANGATYSPGLYFRRPDRTEQFSPTNFTWSPRAQRGKRNIAHLLRGKTLEEWGEILGVTRQRVHQLVQRLGCIENVLSDRGINL